MSITFRKRPDHTLSAPEAKEPHLDLHSIDAGQKDSLDDDDIPVLLPAEPAEPGQAVRHTVYTPAPNRAAPATSAPSTSPDRALMDHVVPDRTTPDEAEANRTTPTLKREATAVHIPPPPSVPRPAPAQTVVQPSTPELPGHPTTQDYAPFLNTAKNRQDPHNKPELYVWSDDENDAFAQVAKRDFTLNRIEPTAGRPSFDASLFRAPSRPEALASVAAPAGVADAATAMQAEIDTLVTELLDESHDYLKRRFLEEIPEIIAKYRQN